MASTHGSLLYEGKAKQVFETDNPDEFLVHFKNDATAFNAKKHALLDAKGSLNCQISAFIFKFLESKGVKTHFLNTKEDCWMLVQRVEVIPLEIVVRNVATGSLCKETPIEQVTKLQSPLLDLYYKDDGLGDPLLTDARLDLLELVKPGQMAEIQNLAFNVNRFL